MSTNTKKSKSSEETLEKLRAFINEKGGIVKKEEFAALDVDYRKILEFVETGTLVRIKNGYYTDRIDRFSEEELIARLFPDARLCMESALYAYGYIREKPYGWHLAVDKNTSKSRFKMDYPKVIPYYTEPEALELGSTTIEQNGLTFQIYDKERIICDCLKYEAKLDRAIFREAVQSSEVFQRDENNIYVVFPITYSQAVLGDTITVPSIDGKVEVNVPEGTQSGTTFRLRGKGVQYVNGRGRGDMYVKCEVEIPKKLSRTQREALKKFEGTLKEDNYEKRKGFFKKLKDMFNN